MSKTLISIFALILIISSIFIFNFNDVFASETFNFSSPTYTIDFASTLGVNLSFNTSIANPKITYIIEDKSIIQINNNVCYPLKEGSTKVTAIEQTTGLSDTAVINVLSLVINNGTEAYSMNVDGSDVYFYANQTDTIKSVLDTYKNTNNIDLNYKLGSGLTDSMTLASLPMKQFVVNFKHKITVKSGLVTIQADKSEATVGEIVKISILNRPSNINVAKIKVVSSIDETINISQTNMTFTMGYGNVEVLMDVKDYVLSTSIGKIAINSDKGLGEAPKLTIKDTNINASKLPIPNSSVIAKYYEVTTNISGDVTITMEIPKAMEGKDGIIIGLMENGLYREKEIYIEGNKMSFSANNLSSFAILTKKHEKEKNLVGLIIAFAFLNCLAFVGIIILSMKYIDHKQNPQKYNKNRGYSSLLPLLILAAARPTQIAGVVVLAFLLLVQIIVLIILIVKLTEKGAVLTSSDDYKQIKY